MSEVKIEDVVFKEYIQKRITDLPYGPKQVMKALDESPEPLNKENLSLKSGIRRGELNYVVIWLEALAFIIYKSDGRQKLYSLTSLGQELYQKYTELFQVKPGDEQRIK